MTVEHELWRRGQLSYKLHAAQKEIYEKMNSSSDFSTIFLCARRWGKSFIATIVAIETAILNPSCKVLIVAPTKSSAYDIYTPLMETIRKDSPQGFVKQAKSACKWLVGQSEIVFSGFDTIADDLRGRGTILIILDEAGFTLADSFTYVTKSVLLPMNQKTIGKKRGRIIYVSTPAPHPDHPFNIMWESAEEAGKLHRYTIYDNPILTPEDIEEIIQEQGGITSIGFLREYMCQNVRDVGTMIIPMFNKACIMDSKSGIDIVGDSWISCDLGGMRDKTVAMVLGRRVNDGKIVIYSETVHEHNTDTKTIGDSILELQQKYSVAPHNLWVDASGQTQVDLYKLCGLTPVLPPKPDKDGAIAALNSAFYNGQIFVSSDCQFTIDSFMNCTFNKTRTDFLRTVKYGHADAVMTAVYGFRVAETVPYSKSLLKYENLQRNRDLNSLAKALIPSKMVWSKT